MGMGTSVSTAVSERTAVIIEDYMFDAAVAGELTPEESPSDFHDTWDLDGTDFTPEASPDDEGYWDDLPNIVLNGDYEELGSEIINNGTYDADSNWTKGTGWSIANGVASSVDSGNGEDLQQGVGGKITSGKTYKVEYTISNRVTGGVKTFLSGGGAVQGNTNTANGTYTDYLTAPANNTTFKFTTASGGFTGSIDNVSVKQVDPNSRWSLGTNVSISDGKLNWANSPNNNGGTQSSSLTQGTAYEITFTVSDYSSGSVRIRFPFVGTRRTANGTYTQIGVADQSTSDIFIQGEESGGNTATLSVDNVSIKEYAITPLDV